MIDAPCKGCEERSAECHCTCEKYKAYREQCKEIKYRAKGLRMMLDYNNQKARRLYKLKKEANT